MKRLIAIAFALALGSAFAAGGLVRGAAARASYVLEGGRFFGLTLSDTDGLGGTITMVAVGSAPSVNLEYSTDNCIWHDFTVGATTVTVSRAGIAMFRAKTLHQNTALASSNSAYNKFVITGNLSASGNISSLLRGDVEVDEVNTDYAFSHLFYNCSTMRGMPDIPGCDNNTVYTYAFYNSGIGPSWVNTSVKKLSDYMFAYCKNLTYIYTEANNTDTTGNHFGNGNGNGVVYAPYLVGFWRILNTGYKTLWLPSLTSQTKQEGQQFGTCDFVYTPKFTGFSYLGSRSAFTIKNWDWAGVKSFYNNAAIYVTHNLWVTNSTQAQCASYSMYSNLTNNNKRTTLTIWYADGKHNWNATDGWVFTEY